MTHSIRLRFPTLNQKFNIFKGSVCEIRVNGISLSFFNNLRVNKIIIMKEECTTLSSIIL